MDYLFLPSGEILEDFLDCAAISSRLQPGDKFFILQFPAPPAYLQVATDRRVSFNLPAKYFDGRRLYFYGKYFEIEDLLASDLHFGLNKLYPYDHTFLFKPNLSSPGARLYWISLNHTLVSKQVLKNLNTLFRHGKGGRFLDFELNPSDFSLIILDDTDFFGYTDILYYTQEIKRYWLITKPNISKNVLDWLFGHREAYAHPHNEIKAAMDFHALFSARLIVAKTPAFLERLGLYAQPGGSFYYALTSYAKFVV